MIMAWAYSFSNQSGVFEGPHEMMLNLVSCTVQPCQVCYCRCLCCWWWSTWSDAELGELHCLCCWWWSMWNDAKFGESHCSARSSMLLTLSLLLVVVHSLFLERYWQKPRSSVSFVIFSISYCAGVTWEAYSGSICVCAISCDECSAYKYRSVLIQHKRKRVNMLPQRTAKKTSFFLS